MSDTSTRPVYTDPEHAERYFGVLRPLPGAPAGSVTINVSGFGFGLPPAQVAEFLAVLDSNGEYVEMMHLVETDGCQDPMLVAYAERDGSTDVQITFGWPNETVHRVVIPAAQSAAVRAAIEEAGNA